MGYTGRNWHCIGKVCIGFDCGTAKYSGIVIQGGGVLLLADYGSDPLKVSAFGYVQLVQLLGTGGQKTELAALCGCRTLEFCLFVCLLAQPRLFICFALSMDVGWIRACGAPLTPR